jgi:serine/threonine protein kinase
MIEEKRSRWELPIEVIDYIENEIGGYDLKVIHQRPLGVVLQATSLFISGHQQLVIKVISLESKRLKNEFKREVKLHSQLQRSAPQYICKLLKSKRIYITQNGGHEVGVMIMEKMEMDLMDYILNTKFIPISTIKMIFKVICQSVLECHKQGITHLDLKPENILLNLLGRAITDIKLCDFGCSFQHHSSSSSSSSSTSKLRDKIQRGMIGTLQYLPPECVILTSTFQNQRRLQAEKIDIYSLGVVLFVMISKRFPKVYSDDCSSIFSFVDSTQGDYFELLQSFHRGCTRQSAELVAWMMNDEAALRPSSIEDVLSHPFFC